MEMGEKRRNLGIAVFMSKPVEKKKILIIFYFTDEESAFPSSWLQQNIYIKKEGLIKKRGNKKRKKH